MKDQSRRLTLLASAASAAMMVGTTAWAQEAATAAAGGDAQSLEAVVVTGTRLQASGFTTPTPVTVVGNQLLQQRGKVNIAEALNEIPSFQPSSGSSQATRNSTGTTGANLVDLRALGTNRTLVLIDSRRVVPFFTTGAVDVSMIPVNLIDRVEVVTGGASAQYGSDAVAGVVNFILRDRMEGFRANIQGGVSERGDARNYAINLAYGHSFANDRLHLIAGADWQQNNAVKNQYQRDWGAKDTGQIGLTANRTPGLPANMFGYGADYSTVTPGGLIGNMRGPDGRFARGPLTGQYFNPDGSLSPFQYGPIVGGTEMLGGGNYGVTESAVLPLAAPSRRFSSLVRLNFELTPTTTLYAEGSYAYQWLHSRSIGALVDTGSVLGPGNFAFGLENPFLPPAVRATLEAQRAAGNPNPGFLLGRYTTEMGPFQGFNTTQTYRGVIGARGTVFGDWNWDVYGEIGHTHVKNDERTWIEGRRYEAMYAVTGPDGQPVCGPAASNPYFRTLSGDALNNILAALDSSRCVPFNPFGAGRAAQGALDYIMARTVQPIDMNQYVGAASISGTPFSVPAGEVSVAAGAEVRKDTALAGFDRLAFTAQYWGFNNQPLDGEQTVYEFFAETGVPLVKDVTLIKSLNFNGAVRQTHYSQSGWVTTWKVGGEYEPWDFLRFRATKSRDIRAPHMNELFQQGGGAYNIVVNPGNGVTDTILSSTSGNPDLKPEVANTFTAGFVFQPKGEVFGGLRLSVDYFKIKLNGVIGTVGVNQILNRYFVLGQTQYASQIHFNNSPIGIGKIDVQYQNLNKLETDGIDIELAYRVPIDRVGLPGQFDVNVLASWLNNLTTIDTSGATVTSTDRVGFNVPEWKGAVRFMYTLNRLQVQTQARMFSQMLFSNTLIGPDDPRYSPTLPNSVNDNTLPAGIYWSLSASYNIVDRPNQTLQIFGVVDNLFDKDPPIQAIELTKGSGIQYDLVGRAFKIGARLTM